MVAWLVQKAIGESDELDHLKSLTNPEDPKWREKVIVDSPTGIGGFGEEALSAYQQDHKQSAYNVKTQEYSVVVGEDSSSYEYTLEQGLEFEHFPHKWD